MLKSTKTLLYMYYLIVRLKIGTIFPTSKYSMFLISNLPNSFDLAETKLLKWIIMSFSWEMTFLRKMEKKIPILVWTRKKHERSICYLHISLMGLWYTGFCLEQFSVSQPFFARWTLTWQRDNLSAPLARIYD